MGKRHINFSDILSSSKASLRFPLDKVENADDYIMFSIYEYQPPFRKAKCLDDAAGSVYGGKYADYDTTGLGGGDLSGSEFKRMVLYMPEDIRMDQGVSWSGKSPNSFQIAGMRAVSAGTAGKSGIDLGAGIQSGKDDFKTAGISTLLKTLAVSQGSKIAGVDANVASGGIVGQVINPNLEVFFDKPELRSFRFNWTLVPRNQRESRIIKEMIWTFKRAAAPELASGGWFLKVPNVFKIQYKTGANDNHWLNKIKACALTNISVNYTASGMWSTLEDGAPTAVGLDLSFMEIKTILADDYGDSFQHTKQYY
jgi:hypothetical protein|tara:strand:+ start:598 stop:1530 length:933 start_codon:yes stop_codon:yes gene_type:complete